MTSALAALLLAFGDLSARAGALLESRAGEAPIQTGATPQGFVAQVVTPMGDVVWTEPGFVARVRYSPRLFWQTPTPPSASRLLLLHNAQVVVEDRATPTLFLSLSGTGSLGEPDYTALPQVLGTVQASLPPVVKIVSGTARGSLDLQVSRSLALRLVVQSTHWHWLDVPPEVVSNSLVTSQTSQTSWAAEPGASYRLSERSTAGLAAAVAYASYSNDARILTTTPSASFKTRLTRLQDLKLTLGVTAFRSLTTTPLLVAGETGVAPVGSVSLDARLARSGPYLVSGAAGAGVEYYLDPVLGTGVPRAISRLALNVASARAWSGGVGGDLATSLRQTPLPGDPDETAVALSAWIRTPVSRAFVVQCGVRWADRGPALASPSFAFHQRQLWAFVTLTGAAIASTSGATEGWAPSLYLP